MDQIKESGWIRLLRAIRYKNIPEIVVRQKFHNLVPKEDYAISDKENLIKFAVKYSSTEPRRK